jgi:hypothetical protein
MVAEAGVPRIFCEKPMATSLTDCGTMINVCERHGVRLALNHARRWSPRWRAVRDLLASGRVGPLRSIHVSLGGGRLGCNASHLFDLIRMITGQEFVDATGWLDTAGTPDPRGAEFRDPGGHAVLHLADGTRVFLEQMEDLLTQPVLHLATPTGFGLIDELHGRRHRQPAVGRACGLRRVHRVQGSRGGHGGAPVRPGRTCAGRHPADG